MNALKMTRTRMGRSMSRVVLGGVLVVGAGSLGGCETAGEGMFVGAALGALTGVALGSLSGNAGEGAIAGTIIGAAGGAVIGDANRHDREYGSRRDRDYGYGYSSGRSHRGGHRHSGRDCCEHSWWEDDWCD